LSSESIANAERQTLQNAVSATDQQTDALVYELWGLTEDEIKLVEGNADATTLGLRLISHRLPRVARASQPWAERCNPFGNGL